MITKTLQAFHRRSLQSSQTPSHDETVASQQQMLEAHLPRCVLAINLSRFEGLNILNCPHAEQLKPPVGSSLPTSDSNFVWMCSFPASKVICTEECTKGTLPALHGDDASHLDGTSFQSLGMPVRAVTTSTFRDLLQCVTPFNSDDAVSFVYDWSAARPTSYPSERLSHPISSHSTSLREQFHEACARHEQPVCSSERLAAQYDSDSSNLRSFSDFRSVVDELEDLNYARGSVHGSESPQSDPENHQDYSRRHEYDIYGESEDTGADASWQLQPESAVAATDSTAQSDSASQGQEQSCRHQAQMMHLAQSLGASAAYVQQLQEVQRRTELHIQEHRLEISSLRFALTDAHVRNPPLSAPRNAPSCPFGAGSILFLARNGTYAVRHTCILQQYRC